MFNLKQFTAYIVGLRKVSKDGKTYYIVNFITDFNSDFNVNTDFVDQQLYDALVAKDCLPVKDENGLHLIPIQCKGMFYKNSNHIAEVL